MKKLALGFAIVFLVTGCAKGRIEPGAFVVNCSDHQVSAPANQVDLPVKRAPE